ncbi:leucyl aminopeptidase [Candidatus Binatia bacterium]|nr:leucyl aminopeptidase [Candidatus Binatia bacterium]
MLRVDMEVGSPTEVRADLLALAVGPDETASLAEIDRRLRGRLGAALRARRFGGKEGEAVVCEAADELEVRYVLVVGCGGASEPSVWYKFAQAALTRAPELGATRIAVSVPAARRRAEVVEAIAEGFILGAYTFDHLKSAPASTAGVRQVAVLVPAREPELETAVAAARAGARATSYARDLVNLPAAIATPTYLAREARRIARDQRLRVRVLTGPGLRRARMGAILGVSQGSDQPPCFIELVYTPRRRRPGGPCVALAGKGITFDSGGLSLKPAESMQVQKRDMAGAAAVLGAMSVVRTLGVAVEVRGYVAAAENMPGSGALKPGDVVRAANGKSIEVLNTDAEGRLVLADALSYASARKPDVLIDLATLTAAVRTALGSRCAAIMATDADLARDLIAAGRACGENLWELPLIADYRGELDSLVADLKNIGDGAGAGTIIGGLFLREFVTAPAWAHIDFSSTVVTDKPLPAHPRGATGFGVRTLLRYLRRL